MADGLHTPGVVSAAEARLADAGLIAVQGPGALDVRTGVLLAPGTVDALVVGTADTAPMAVLVNPHHWVTARGSADGVYRGALEAATRVTLAAAPGAGSRIDVIYDKQLDATSTLSADGSTAFTVDKATGTVGAGKPAIPVGAEEIATVTVSAGATATNDGTHVVIAQTSRQTVARGAPIPVRSQSARNLLTTYPGLHVIRLDLGGVIQRWVTGATWVTYVSDADVAPTSGDLTLSTGWSAFSTYSTPGWELSSDGVVTCWGMAKRTGANSSLVIGTAQTFATFPGSCSPPANASPLTWVALGNTGDTYPARLFIPGGSTNLQVTGMSSGTGTFFTNQGLICLDGVSWRVR